MMKLSKEQMKCYNNKVYVIATELQVSITKSQMQITFNSESVAYTPSHIYTVTCTHTRTHTYNVIGVDDMHECMRVSTSDFGLPQKFPQQMHGQDQLYECIHL